MEIKYFEYSVVRDSQTTLAVQVSEVEAKILSHVFGENNVKQTSKKVVCKREIEPAEEAQRLFDKYGQDAIEAAYGSNFRYTLVEALSKKKSSESAQKTEEKTEEVAGE